MSTDHRSSRRAARRAEDERDEHGQEGDLQIGARRVQQSSQDVAAEVVRAKGVIGDGPWNVASRSWYAGSCQVMTGASARPAL